MARRRRRAADKRLLADVVHARTTGIDVDKNDYLLRDAEAVRNEGRYQRRHPRAGHPRTRGTAAARLCRDGGVRGGASTWRRIYQTLYQHCDVLDVERRLLAVMRNVDAATPSGTGCAILPAPERFVSLRDDDVGARPEVHRVGRAVGRSACATGTGAPPVAVMLRTRPSCARCGAATHITDRFCLCGHRRRATLCGSRRRARQPRCALTDVHVEAALAAAERTGARPRCACT